MLSAAKYPYMNRAARRNPDSYAKGLGSLAVLGSALLLALLVHAGFVLAGIGKESSTPATLAQPNPVIAAIRNRGKSIVNGIKGMFKKLFS